MSHHLYIEWLKLRRAGMLCWLLVMVCIIGGLALYLFRQSAENHYAAVYAGEMRFDQYLVRGLSARLSFINYVAALAVAAASLEIDYRADFLPAQRIVLQLNSYAITCGKALVCGTLIFMVTMLNGCFAWWLADAAHPPQGYIIAFVGWWLAQGTCLVLIMMVVLWCGVRYARGRWATGALLLAFPLLNSVPYNPVSIYRHLVWW